MAKKPLKTLQNNVSNKSQNPIFKDLVDSVSLLNPGANVLPTSDPGEPGALFVTASEGFEFGSITGSGFAVFCVSQG